MKFFIKNCDLNKEKIDCIVVGMFDDHQLTISANYLDKCSNGYITSSIKFGDIQGKLGQSLLLYNIPNVVSKRILLVGCGNKKIINRSNFKLILHEIMKVLKKTSIKQIIISLSDLKINNDINNNIYWIIRFTISTIKHFLYKVHKITNIKQNTIMYSIILNILKPNSFTVAETALKHGLAINDGIVSSKNISNLPPNICNPIYLSYKARQLAQKYPKNVNVEIVDMITMKNLGMNAYVSVGDSSTHKPFMSVIKYSSSNLVNHKTIALVGKGLTFDSGGLSLKPANNMHEMKYDMSGAAAVYGTLVMALKLQLPLNIIGILAGCENMIGSNSLRPGDVLTTMSGKTVEVLNTDAEGRLVLCDVLTYLERFTPDIVIDIATLTGACVTALGEHVSGLFVNDEILFKELDKASKETDDKIWRMPLFEEYQKELNSKIADFSNIGRGKAGAITAACFLSRFTQKYRWAHFDIAGTAWTSGRDIKSTGRPVELLCQFLLNKSNYMYS